MPEISECEKRDNALQIEVRDARIAELEEKLRDKKFYFGMVSAALVFCIIFFIAASVQRESFKDGAIKRGVLQYNPTNGVLQWVPLNK